ncbi:hypothetical protein OUZ56_005332 [Daphnia magna]|uniref:Uncharacterized protein n=1 Tax=Daphnia magna TaxID=35525 RepID=A0ABQ9YSJ9_9CRUS|nr:hypothetical protein OUZ56_005332 [Daphnia magna]
MTQILQPSVVDGRTCLVNHRLDFIHVAGEISSMMGTFADQGCRIETTCRIRGERTSRRKASNNSIRSGNDQISITKLILSSHDEFKRVDTMLGMKKERLGEPLNHWHVKKAFAQNPGTLTVTPPGLAVDSALGCKETKAQKKYPVTKMNDEYPMTRTNGEKRIARMNVEKRMLR